MNKNNPSIRFLSGHDADDESSEYLGLEGREKPLDFSGLFSNRFSNIVPLYRSADGPADIYSATRYGKRFVLKGLKEQFRDDPLYNLALSKEFEIGILLDHPNIRRTLSLEKVEGLGRVIVLEYVDGVSLADMLESGGLTVSSARNIVRQIADALGYLHSRQIFHRDLKPSNILVSRDADIVRLIDFNLSDSNEFVILKNPAGSRRYMAPELMKPDSRPTTAADIYSFGMVMKELASATGDSELAELADRCVKQDPDKRPRSVSALRIPSVNSRLGILTRWLSSKTLTYILVFACIGLATLITYLLISYN